MYCNKILKKAVSLATFLLFTLASINPCHASQLRTKLMGGDPAGQERIVTATVQVILDEALRNLVMLGQ